MVRPLALTAVVTALGIAFNLGRLALRLDTGPLWLSLTAFWALGIVSLLLARLVGVSPSGSGIARPAATRSLIGGSAAVVILAGAAFATAPHVHLPGPSQLLAGLLLFVAATAPVEEYLFRGVLYGSLVPATGPVVAVAATSVSFAAAHVPVYGWVSLPLAISAGLILGWLRWYTRSLAAPIAVHAAADLALLWL